MFYYYYLTKKQDRKPIRKGNVICKNCLCEYKPQEWLWGDYIGTSTQYINALFAENIVDNHSGVSFHLSNPRAFLVLEA